MEAMEKKTDVNRRNKTEQIFTEAIKIFARYGYRKTSLEDIASELKMTKSNLYLYVKDKKDLYEKSVAHALKKWQKSAADTINPDEDPVNQLVTFAMAGYTYLGKDPDLRNILADDPDIFPLFPEEDHFYKINFDSMTMMKEIMKKGIKEKKLRDMDLEYTAPFLYSIYVMFIIKTYIKAEEGPMDKTIAAAIDVILNGLLAR